MPVETTSTIPEAAIYAVTAVCLALTIALVAYVAIRLVSANGRERLSYLRRFRNGQFAIIYAIAIPMGVLAFMYTGYGFGGALLYSVYTVVDLVVLKLEYPLYAPLMENNAFFCAVMIVMYVVIVCNAVLFTFSLAGRFIVNRARLLRCKLSRKDIYVVVGGGENNRTLVASAGKGANAVILADPSPEEKDEIYLTGRSLLHFTSDGDLVSVLSKLDGKGRKLSVIVNTGSDEENLILLERVSAYIKKKAEQGVAAEDLKFAAYAFGDPVSASAYMRFEESTKGVIRYVSKYRMTAIDFIDKYPITRFMTDEIDTQNAIVRPDVDVNVAYIGFGKANIKLFLTSVENDCLMTLKDGKYEDKPISYWIFDKRESDGEKNLNHNYHRYANEMLAYGFVPERDYFELPPYPADTEPSSEHFLKEDINSRAFYLDLRSRLKAKAGRRAYNYIVIAFGTDMENLDLAEKISAKLREWNMDGYTHVFVKIRSGRFARSVVCSDKAYTSSFNVFGVEDEVVYDIAKITREKTEAMAMRRHVRYSAAGADEGMTEEEIVRVAKKKWYGKWVQVQRESNTYACLALRMKLNLMGYDYVPADEEGEDVSAEFAERYFAGDPPKYEADGVTIDYGDCEFRTDTIRARYAMQEHQRWNAYMICNGYIPATKEEAVTADKTELMRRRKHGNLTTFAGLIDYRNYAAERRGTDPATEDVIKYDYQLMDYAADLLGSCGYKIVRRATEKSR